MQSRDGGPVTPLGNGSRTATGCVYDPVFLRHSLLGHPERPERLSAVVVALEEAGLWHLLQQVPARPATTEELTSVHPVSYIERVKALGRAGGGHLDPDTYMNRHSYAAAVRAAGGLIDLTLAVSAGQLQNGFGLVRPPGHHAMRTQPMGFCIFNNLALAARAVQRRGDLERLAIVDFDVHHGNGTQDVFAADPMILYISTHQYPHFPGTGRLDECGAGEGAAALVNLPLPAGVGDAGFRALYSEIVLPVLERFQPQLILVSAGYDGHWADPLAGLSLSLAGYVWLSRILTESAERLCEGKIVFTLEGGYDLEVLGAGVANSIKVMLGRSDFSDPLGEARQREPDLTPLIAAAKQLHRLSG
jgi:acetoin utilization deacetylase AcuC-like enzyme